MLTQHSVPVADPEVLDRGGGRNKLPKWKMWGGERYTPLQHDALFGWGMPLIRKQLAKKFCVIFKTAALGGGVIGEVLTAPIAPPPSNRSTTAPCRLHH